MKMAIVLGAALAFAPGIALAEQGANQNQPATQNQMNQNQNEATQNQNQNQNKNQNQYQNQNENQPQAQNANQADITAKKLLPKDAKLVGSVESADVRAFPEQMSKATSGNIEKEGVVGVGALDRVWTTKQSYQKTVSHLEQTLKGENIEPIAKTTTKSSTAWNVRMPDGHIANMVVRNTQPTTIEAVQAAAMMGSETLQNENQPTSSPKNKTNLSNPSKNLPSNPNP